jgi:hypothetical protein
LTNREQKADGSDTTGAEGGFGAGKIKRKKMRQMKLVELINSHRAL